MQVVGVGRGRRRRVRNEMKWGCEGEFLRIYLRHDGYGIVEPGSRNAWEALEGGIAICIANLGLDNWHHIHVRAC